MGVYTWVAAPLLKAAVIALWCVWGAGAWAGPTVRGFVEYNHRSDLFQGWPGKDRPGTEPVENSVALGAEFSWPMTRLSLSHGVYARDCTLDSHCRWRSGTHLQVRRYFTKGN